MNPSLRFVLILVGVLALVVLIAGDPDGSDPGPPLSPEGTGPSGAKAMTILLDELGADVDVDRGVPDADVETAVLLQDRLDDGRREALGRWVEDGGTLVVADPASGLTPPVAEPLGSFAGFGDIDLDAGDCDMDALADVEHLALGGGVLYESSAGSARCFDDGAGAFVVESAFGQGRVIAVGGPYPFTNEGLGRADAAVLVADLLAPEPEGTRVAFLDRADPVDGRPGGGDETLLDLVPDRVVLALIQLGLAFGAYVWFRARRAGRPVAEPLPTTLAGSELVAAVGQLLAQERDPERAAGLLRDDLRRTLGRRLGLGPDASLDELLAAAERAGADPDRLRDLVAGRTVADGEALTTLARDIDVIRREVLHEQH